MAAPDAPDAPNGQPIALASLWELDSGMRASARERGCITAWANARVIGVPSCGAMSLNIKALEITAEWWASQVTEPQAVPIDSIRNEVGLITVLSKHQWSSSNEKWNHQDNPKRV